MVALTMPMMVDITEGSDKVDEATGKRMAQRGRMAGLADLRGLAVVAGDSKNL